jgi:hypothetical protein
MIRITEKLLGIPVINLFDTDAPLIAEPGTQPSALCRRKEFLLPTTIATASMRFNSFRKAGEQAAASPLSDARISF